MLSVWISISAKISKSWKMKWSEFISIISSILKILTGFTWILYNYVNNYMLMSNCIIFFNLFQLGWGWGSILVHKTSIFKLDSDIYIHIYIIIYISIFIYRYMHVINYMYRYTTVFLGIYCLLSVQLCKHVILYNVFYLSIFPCTIFFNTETLVDNRDPWH